MVKCEKRSNLAFSLLDPHGHVVDHALNCEKTVKVKFSKVKFLYIISSTLIRSHGIRLEC